MLQNLQVFIGGTGRCGTTILGKVLEGIGDITYFVEPRIIIPQHGLMGLERGIITYEQFAGNIKNIFVPRTILSFLDRDSHCRAQEIDYYFYDREYMKAIIDHLLKVRTIDAAYDTVKLFIEHALIYFNTTSFIYKTPNLIYCVEMLRKMYKNSYFIHIIRDPKDVYESVIARNLSIKDVSKFSTWYCMKMNRAYNVYNKTKNAKYIVVSFERLIDNPKHALADILCKIGIKDNETTINKCLLSIDSSKSHIRRHHKLLGDSDKVKQYKYIEDTCYPIYKEWLELAI